tara:strand:+ start:1712 stop:1930 length:219 start_codon:yes stop_codon:yes gene_type:complete
MEISWFKIIIILFSVWMAYFSLGAFANMTENKVLLSIFKLFKILLITAIIIVVAMYFLNGLDVSSITSGIKK